MFLLFTIFTIVITLDKMRKAFVFTERTNYGEFVAIVVADDIDEALDMKNKEGVSLRDTNWSKDNLSLELETTNDKGVVFEGGGDL